MFHGKLTQGQPDKRRSARLARAVVITAALFAGFAWTAQASADITVIYSSDDRDRHHRHNHRHNHHSGVDLIGSLLMPGSLRHQNIRHSRFDRHHDRKDRHNRYDRCRAPQCDYSSPRQVTASVKSGRRNRKGTSRGNKVSPGWVIDSQGVFLSDVQIWRYVALISQPVPA